MGYIKMKKVIVLFSIAIFLLTACSKTPEELYAEQLDLGIRYLSESNYEEAIVAFEAAIVIDPKNPVAYIEIADVYVEQGDIVGAVRFLDESIQNIKNLPATDEDIENQTTPEELEDTLAEQKETVYDNLPDEEKLLLNNEGIYGNAEEQKEAEYPRLPLDAPEMEELNLYIYQINVNFSSPGMPVFDSIENADANFLLGNALIFTEGVDRVHYTFTPISALENSIQEHMTPDFSFEDNFEFVDIGWLHAWNEEEQGYETIHTGGFNEFFKFEILEAFYTDDNKLMVYTLEYATWADSGYDASYADIYNDGVLVGRTDYLYDEYEYIGEETTYTIDPSEHVRHRYVLIPKEDGGYYIESKTYLE